MDKKDSKEYVYLVSSFHRSGSSMMMRCLEGGGMNARYDTHQEIMNIIYGKDDYKPNPNGFYGLNLDIDSEMPLFYELNKGRLLKLPKYDFRCLTSGKYKMVFMVRNPKEILASMRKFTPYTTWGMMMVAVYFYDIIKDALIRKLKARGDVDVIEINYKDVVENPQREFEKIRDFGFPINVAKASELVEPSLYRLRLEVN